MEILTSINSFLWSKILIVILAGAGLYFSFKLNFVQITKFKHAVGLLFRKDAHDEDKEGLSSLQAFWTSMASRVGTGNMAGVAVAITLGGPGAIFWMWVITIFGMATSMIETTLAQLYKVRDEEGQFRGGPAYYMEQGLGSKLMGTLFSISLIVGLGLAINSVQSNTIAEALNTATGISKPSIGLFIALLTGLVIFGGQKLVAKVSEKVVPIMSGMYILLALVIVALNIENVIPTLKLIVSSALGFEQASAGIMGAIIAGVARGLFSNEAGMGSSVNIAASVTPKPHHPASQGYIQMVGVFVDTMVICTASAAIILLTGSHIGADTNAGVSLIQEGLSKDLGSFAYYLVTASILLFSYTSIIACYSYAETNLKFMTKKKTPLMLLRIALLVTVYFASFAALKSVWIVSDIAMATMTLINMAAIILLSKKAITVVRDYESRLASGTSMDFELMKYPEIAKTVKCDTWKISRNSVRVNPKVIESRKDYKDEVVDILEVDQSQALVDAKNLAEQLHL